MNVPAKLDVPSEVMERALGYGDFSKMTSKQRVEVIATVCKSIGVNPLTRPLEFIKMPNGNVVLYAKKDCTDQLRRLNAISIEVLSQTNIEGLYTVHVQAKDAEGRTDEDFGVVSLPDTAKGDFRANLILKAITKAKRRVTLSICGLGFLDETETETIPGARPIVDEIPDEIPNFAEQVDEKAERDADPVASPPDSPPAAAGSAQIQSSEAIMSVEDRARVAAKKGEKIFYQFYKTLNEADKMKVNAVGAELRELMSDVS